LYVVTHTSINYTNKMLACIQALICIPTSIVGTRNEQQKEAATGFNQGV
jgi:hypothetical protein